MKIKEVSIEKYVPGEVSEQYTVKTYDKKDVMPFEYLPKKTFRQYMKDNEDNDDVDIRVVGNLKVYKKEVKPAEQRKRKPRKRIGTAWLERSDKYKEKFKDKKDYETELKRMDLYEAESKYCFGYAYVGDDNWIRLQRRGILPLILWFLLIGLLCVLFIVGYKNDWNPNAIFNDPVTNTDTVKADTEYIHIFPINGNNRVTITADKPAFSNLNSAQNTVYFRYRVVDPKSGETLWQMNEGDYIKPGGYVTINVYDKLKTGENTVDVCIDTFDVDTGAVCDGGTLKGVIITKN